MSETRNAANRLALYHDSAGPAALSPAGDRYVTTSGINLRRRIFATLARRDPHRQPDGVKMPQSSFAVEWDWVLSAEVGNLYRVLDGLSDAGRGEAITGGLRWRIGMGGQPVAFNALVEGVADGTRWEGRHGIFTDCTLTAERKSIVKVETTLSFLEFDTAETLSAADPALDSGPAVTALDVSATVSGDASQPVFGIVLGFQREADAAGFGEDGKGTAWRGRLTPDIAGRMILRATAERFDQAYRDADGLVTDVVLSLAIPGGLVLTVDMPACLMKCTARTLVDDNLYEHVLDFTALAEEGEDAAVIELTGL